MTGILKTPRVLIAAPGGRSGKTTVSLGICNALTRRGYRVQPFKKGPDYIDPSWLSAAAGRACKTLDPYFLAAPETDLSRLLPAALAQRAGRADLVFIESNHGLYDSAISEDGWGSAAMVARNTATPVLLVVNAARTGRSLAALVSGFQNFEPDTPIRGVILNNVAGVKPGGRHEKRAREAIERYCGLPVVGALPRLEGLHIPDRHLGLIPVGERDAPEGSIEACRRAAERYLDLDAIIEIARSAPDLKFDGVRSDADTQVEGEPVTLGVLRDRAFSFYYPENLGALERAGAKLVFINALEDPNLPPVSGLYIGGGFPEVFAEQLAENRSLRNQIRVAIENDLPVYAECGGLMYLCRDLTWQENTREMVGALPYRVEMTERPQGHGYVEALVSVENPFFPVGMQLRGHEFHNSRLIPVGNGLPGALSIKRGTGIGSKIDGLITRNVFASYIHLHADGAPGWAQAFVGLAQTYEARKVRAN